MKRALCIWLPEWPIQRIVAARRELEQALLVLHARDSRRGRLVVGCCAKAHAVGVRTGMPLAEVSALQEHLHGQSRDRDWLLCEHEPDEDLRQLTDLAVWCEQFSPIVGLEDADQPACLLLDVTGLAPIFGSEQRLVELVVEAFGQRGYQVRVGVADTVGAAWALAHYGADPAADDLGVLPVEALRLPDETVATLHQLGIETIFQLLQLPRDGLATRLGETLITRLDQALGRTPEVIVAHRAPPQFVAEWDLEHPTTRRDTIDTILQQLTERVSGTLARNGHAAVQVEATLVGQRISRTLAISLFQPSSNPAHIYDLLQLQLETSQMREPVRRVQLAAVTTVRLAGEQSVLWGELGQGRDQEVAGLVDRLSSRLGRECVFGINAQAGALPERSWKRRLLTETIKSRSRKRETAITLKAPHRPLWLHDPPQPLRVRQPERSSAGAGYLSRLQPPTAFQFQGTHYDVVRHWGPERIETGWWRGKSIRRDYYRVETDGGSRFWVFRQLDDGQWFLHGCFE